jgi:uncharacterized protein YndB with AHSA1/START domain
MNPVLLVIVIIVAIPFVIALFTKKGYYVERSIMINQPESVVFDYLKYLKNQDYFSKWVMTDPDKKTTFSGVDGTVGCIYAWDGNKKAGKGEIIKIMEGELIDIEVRFERPFKAVAYIPFTLTSASSAQTKVTWSMRSKMNYPMNFMLLALNMEKMLGADMDESLVNLKKILETK